MSLQHANPNKHGTQFGQVVVTVDLAMGDCMVRAPQRVGVVTALRKIRFNSLDEIQGAYQAQLMLAQRHPEDHHHAADIARALKHAGQRLKAQQGRNRT